MGPAAAQDSASPSRSQRRRANLRCCAPAPLAVGIVAGSTWNVQATYRDGTIVRTSEALHLVFAP